MENKDFEDYKNDLLQDHKGKSKEQLEKEALKKMQELEDVIATMHVKAFPEIREKDLTFCVYNVIQDNIMQKYLDNPDTPENRQLLFMEHLNYYKDTSDKDRQFMKDADFQTLQETFGFNKNGDNLE